MFSGCVADQVGIRHVFDQAGSKGRSRYAKDHVIVGKLGSDVRLRRKAARRRVGPALDRKQPVHTTI